MNILIVEDERVVAEDMEQRLNMLGYTVSAVASSGKDALQKVKDNPDLILMDIVLGGEIDGIEAAEYIRAHYNIPIVFVTAHTDEKMVERAKVTEPYGYLVKPFQDRELHATIEMALYKHKVEKDLQSERDKLQALMDGLTRTGIGIIIVNSDYTILFQNQSLKNNVGDVTGHICYESYMGLKKPCSTCPLAQTVHTGAVERVEVVDVTGRDYEVISVPLPNPDGSVDRAIEVIKNITERKQTEIQLKKLFEASTLINSTMDITTVFRFISDAYQELVGFDNFMIFLVSEDKTIYPAHASEGIRDKVADLVLQDGEGLVGYCIKTGETLLLGNAHKDERSKKIPGVTEPFTSQIVSPLVIGDECVGAIHISKVEENAYDETDVEALKPLSEVISSAVRNSRLYHEIKEFGQKLEKRIEERARKMEVLLNTRENLQRERNWERGLQIIVESMRQLGVERCGVFLVNPMKKTLEFHLAKGADIPEHFPQMSLRDTEYFGVQCVQEKRTIHVKDYNPAEGKQIMSETQSFVWVPIVVQDEAFAALAADNVKSNTVITDKDAKDLEILAGMCAAFIDRTRLLIEPVAEQTLKTEIKYWLNTAEGYLVIEKRPEKSFEIVIDLITHGIPGFVASRAYPEKLKRLYKLQKTPVVWLSQSEEKNSINPADLSKLCYIVEDFTKRSEESVILLDGIEYLITQAGFDTVLKCMQELKDIVTINNSRLVISLCKDILSQKEYSLLEKEFRVL